MENQKFFSICSTAIIVCRDMWQKKITCVQRSCIMHMTKRTLILYYAFIFLTIAYTIEPYVFIDGLKFPAIMIMVFFFFSKQWRILQLSALFVLILMFFKREVLYSQQISCDKLLWVFKLNPLLKWLFCSLITNHLEFVVKIL